MKYEKTKRYHFIYPRIDRNTTQKHLVDFQSFLKVVFPDNELHQQIAHAITEYLIEHKQAYLMKDLIPYIRNEKRITHSKLAYNPKGVSEVVVSKDTVAKVFKKMVKSGLLSRRFRYNPVELSKIFAHRLKDLANYWENYVDKYA